LKKDDDGDGIPNYADANYENPDLGIEQGADRRDSDGDGIIDKYDDSPYTSSTEVRDMDNPVESPGRTDNNVPSAPQSQEPQSPATVNAKVYDLKTYCANAKRTGGLVTYDGGICNDSEDGFSAAIKTLEKVLI
jgi:hypothetical protein